MGRKSGLYTPLNEYLKNSGKSELTFTLPEINKILEESHHQLPESAYRHRAWWGNCGSNPQAKEGWLDDAGYEVFSVQLNSQKKVEKVTFKRNPNHQTRNLQPLPNNDDEVKFEIEEVKECPACHKTIEKDFGFCPYCGTPQIKKCPDCGTILKEDFNFCPKCGKKREDM